MEKGYFGDDDALAGRGHSEENSEIDNGGCRQGSARAVGWCFPQDDFRIIWPGFLLQAAREGDGMANVGVPCQSLSPHGTSDPGQSPGGGDRSVTRVPGGRGFWRWFIALAGGFWWRGSEARDLWKSAHLSWHPLKAPEEQLCPQACAAGAAGFWGHSLCQTRNGNEQKPRGKAGHCLLGRSRPFPPHFYHPTERPGCSGAEPSAPPRAPGTGRASLKWAEIPQNRVRRNSHPQTRIRGEEQPQGFNAIFPPGREPGPGSWGSQKMSLSSTFSPASGPGMAPAAGPEACESLGFLVHEPGGPCSGPGRGGAAHAGFGLRGLGLRWAEQGMCFGFPEGLTASFHLDV